MILTLDEKRSAGHLAFFERPDGTRAELFEQRGEIYVAPIGNAFDIDTGNRIGRWEGPSWQKDYLLKVFGVTL